MCNITICEGDNEMKFNEYIEMTDEELKQEFIKYFGEEKWEEEESLSRLIKIEETLSNTLIVPIIPVITEDIPEDSRLDIKNECIIISKRLIHNKKEATKCLVHEYRHLYQLIIVNTEPRHPLYEAWKENYKNVINSVSDASNIEEYNKYFMQPIELDAFAYTKYFFEHFLGEPLKIFNDALEEVFDKYIDKIIKNNL